MATNHDSVYRVITDSLGFPRRVVVTCACGTKISAMYGYRESLARRYEAHVAKATATEK